MSEPTPLNAEELAAVRGWKPLTAVRRWLSMSSYRKGKHSRYLATIDAQATEIAGLRGALEETREQLQHDFAIRCRCDFVTKLPAGIERCVGCRARDRIEAISRVLAGKEAQGD